MLDILWIYLNRLKYSDFLAYIYKLDKQNIIFTPNPEIILKTLKDSEFREILLKANYLLPDWIGLFIAYQINDIKYKIQQYLPEKLFAKYLKQRYNINQSIKDSVSSPEWQKEKFINKINKIFLFFYYLFIICLLPYFIFNVIFRKKYIYNFYWEKICWSDLTRDLVEFASKNNILVTIIDLYNPTDLCKVVSQKVFCEKLNNIYPNLNFDYFIYDLSKKEEIIEQIKNSESKILFSTLWMKKQEESIIEIMNKCKNIKIWLWIGSSFDYIVWFQKRAPYFWRNLWLEWLYRLLTWPKKINRLNRLYNAIIVFLYKIITK